MRGILHMPNEVFGDQLRVRSYEVARNGMIGLSTALRYCEALATDASTALGFDPSWYARHHTAWVVRDMDILLGTLPHIGEELRLATWVAEYRRVQAQRDYAIWHATTGEMVVRASARWAYFDTERGQLARIPDELIEAMQSAGHALSLRRATRQGEYPLSGAPTIFPLQTREYEVDTQQHINNCVYADWLGEAFYQAVQTGQLSRDDSNLRPRFYHIEYIHEVLAGDRLRIETQIAPCGTRGVVSRQVIFQATSDAPVVRAYAEHLRVDP